MADTSSFTNDGQNSISSHSSYSDSDSESSVETVIAGYQKSRSRRANKSLGKDGEKEPATKNAMTGKISKTPTDTIEKVTTHSSGRSQENFSPVGESSRTTRYGHGVAAANMKTAINAAAQSYSTLPTPSASTPAALAVMHMQVSDRSGFNRGTGSTIALQLPTATVSRPALRRAQTVASGVHSPGGALRAAGALSIVPSVGSSMSAALAGEEVGRRMLRSEVPDELIDGVEALVDAQCRLHAPHFAQQTIHSLIQSAAVVHPRPLHDEHAHKEHGDGSHGSVAGGAVHPHSHHHSSHQHHHHDGSAARGQHHRAPSVGTDGAGGGGAAAAGGDHAHHVRGNPSRTGATGSHNVPSGGGGHPGAGASDKDSTKSVGSRGGSVSPNSGDAHHRDGAVAGQLGSVRSPRVHNV